VLVDTQAWGNKRKVTAFIGGLDLCDGRYDTPEHRLFKDLDTVFENDYHNPTFSVSSFVLVVLNFYASQRIELVNEAPQHRDEASKGTRGAWPPSCSM
jgi:hypothetical protein